MIVTCFTEIFNCIRGFINCPILKFKIVFLFYVGFFLQKNRLYRWCLERKKMEPIQVVFCSLETLWNNLIRHLSIWSMHNNDYNIKTLNFEGLVDLHISPVISTIIFWKTLRNLKFFIDIFPRAINKSYVSF